MEIPAHFRECRMAMSHSSAPPDANKQSSEPSSAPGGSAESFGQRRLVTVLCYDLAESTSLLHKSDLEDYQELIASFQERAARSIRTHGGTLSDPLGDGGIAVFSSEASPRDSAAAAIAAALGIVEACGRLSTERNQSDLHVRVGVAASAVVVDGASTNISVARITGIAPALATRLQALAQPDTVLVSDQAKGLAGLSYRFRPLGQHRLKGFSQPERVWQATPHKLSIDRFFAFSRHSTPLVGRELELRAIQQCWSKAKQGAGKVALIDGEAGIGKSRLLHEIMRIVRAETRLLLFQCAPEGRNATLHPLRHRILNVRSHSGEGVTSSTISEAFLGQGIADREVTEVFSFLLGAGGPFEAISRISPEIVKQKTASAARRALEILAARGPILIAVEDVHWIDPTSSDLLTSVVQHIQDLPVLVILTSRLPTIEGWPEISWDAVVHLKRFEPEQTRVAMGALAPPISSGQTNSWVDLAVSVTGGIPLFIEEFCRWASERGALPPHGDVSASGAWPGSFESIVGARLDALGTARQVAENAAVFGREFDLSVLTRILPGLSEPTIANEIATLEDAGIVTRNRASSPPSHSFRHVLIQEAIYNALLRKTRRSIHAKVFAALSENEVIPPWLNKAALAFHAERAELFDRAIAILIQAGKESSALSALTESRRLLQRAIGLAERIAHADLRDELKLTALSALGPVVMTLEGSMSSLACSVYDDGVTIARRRPASEQARWFPLYWGWWFTGSDFSIQRQRAQALLENLGNVDDPEIQLQVRHCIWAIEFNMGHHRRAIDAVDAGLTLYQPDRGSETRTLYGGHDARVCGLGQRGLALWFVGEDAAAVRSVKDAVEWALHIDHVGSLAHAYDIQAMLHRYRRDFVSLRGTIEDMRRLSKVHDLPSLAAKAEIFAGWCEGIAGDPKMGMESFETGLEVLRRIETVEDLPVYCDMHAELMAKDLGYERALKLTSEAIVDAERMGHRYWLAELYHRKGRLLLQTDSEPQAVNDAFEASFAVATEQEAVSLLIGAYDTVVHSGSDLQLIAKYRDRIAALQRSASC